MGMVPRILSRNFCYSHSFSILRVRCSCLTLPASSKSRLILASLLHMIAIKWQSSVLNFWDNDWVIIMVTWVFCNKTRYSFVICQLRVNFQQWWWCHEPIMSYIKMILEQSGIVIFHAKSVCGLHRKVVINQKSLLINVTFCYKTGRDIIPHHWFIR